METNKELQKKQNTLRFIEAARLLIDEIGLKKVSIRKIAEQAGFHNSTIYLYFKDIDELILLASLKHFNGYSVALANQSRQKNSPYESFLAIWEFFAQSAFEKPEIFYNFFFGKHSDNLTDVLERYYELFPDEKTIYREDIRSMYFGRNIYERCHMILNPLLEEPGVRLTEENLDLVNDVTVGYLKYLLEQKCQDPKIPAELLSKKLLFMIKYMIDA